MKENIGYTRKRGKLDFPKKTSQVRVENQQTQTKYGIESGIIIIIVFRLQWW